MIALTLLAGCLPTGTATSTGLTVDCTNMIPSGYGNDTWRTPTLTVLQEAQRAEFRCTMWPGAALTGGTGTVSLDGALNRESNLVYFTVAAFGRYFLGTSGEVSFDEWEFGKASGTYAMRAVEAQGVEEVDVQGVFDWCAVGVRSDCPNRIDDTLPDSFTLRSPVFPEVTGKTSACRMMVNPESGALRVDLQAGVWGTANVAQLYVNECTAGAGPVIPNFLVFEAGGTPGPGTYGPFVPYPRDDGSELGETGTLPQLSFTHPLTFLPNLTPDIACVSWGQTGAIFSEVTSACTWTVDPGTSGAGRFVLDCSDIRQYSFGVFPYDETGDFHLDAECQYVETTP